MYFHTSFQNNSNLQLNNNHLIKGLKIYELLIQNLFLVLILSDLLFSLKIRLAFTYTKLNMIYNFLIFEILWKPF